jgi:tRNA pseudouridine13 synthase
MTFDPTSPPLLTGDLPGIAGRIKAHPEDFEVEEVPAYAASGQGDFLYLWVEKRAMGAEFFARQVARRLELAPGDVGTAGLKDRHAVTRQMVSVPASAEPRLGQLDGDGIRLLSVSRHGNKLKPGHLRGNRFRILLRSEEVEITARLDPLLERVRSLGLPNFYGPQRFGRDGETLRLGLDLLGVRGPTVREGAESTAAGFAPSLTVGAPTGKDARRINPFLRRLALSAAQSALFNLHVARRMHDGLLRRVLEGDVMMKWPFGGMFVAQDAAAEQRRCDAREIVVGGPIFGKKMFRAAGEPLRREAETLAEAGLSLATFQGFGKLLSGTRRYTLIYLDDLAGQVEPEGVRLTFTLPAGSYATVLLRELTHSDRLEGDDAEG